MFRSLIQPMWDITIHLPSGPSVLTCTHSFLQSMWDLHQIHAPKGVSFSSLTNVGYHNLPPFRAQYPCLHSFLSNRYETPTKSTPLRSQCFYWHTTLCLPSSRNSLLARTSRGPTLANIVLFGLFLSNFPSRF